MKAPQYNTNWSDKVKALYKHDMREIWDRTISPYIWNQYHNQLDIYFKLVGNKPKRILDIGCAQATLSLMLAERGHHVTAVDIRQSFLDYAKSRYTQGDINFICANALEMELNQQFDIIFANQVIEHLVYPIEFTSNLKRYLARGGKMIMSTPNGKYIVETLPSYTELGDPKQWEHKQFTADGDGHFFAYLPQELKNIFKSSGLKNISIKNFESPWISGHMRFRYLHKDVPTIILKLLDKMTINMPYLGLKFSHQILILGEN